jgi:alkylhydroperoxidase family enzyme
LKSPPNQVDEGILSEALAAVLSYTDAMTLNVAVPDNVFAQVKEHFSEREVVEMTATIAAYNCVSRFLVALDVGERNAQKGPMEGGKE